MIGSWKRILFLYIFSSVALVQAKHHLILTHHPTSWSHPIQFSSCYSSSFNLPKVAASHLATPLPPPFLTCCVRYCHLHSSHLWLVVYVLWRVPEQSNKMNTDYCRRETQTSFIYRFDWAGALWSGCLLVLVLIFHLGDRVSLYLLLSVHIITPESHTSVAMQAYCKPFGFLLENKAEVDSEAIL